MINAMTTEDLGVILAGLALVLMGVLRLTGLLTLESILFIIFIISAVYVSFVAGFQYGQPRRS
ncbi:hypothetical protein [Halorubrum tibetense]|uniref:Uncharacterized protein n=1 Tax=Halorubrum tibetense TaxID=175631 RepID=A0ABD5SDY5_9EURY